MQNCKPINTSIEKGYTLSLDQCLKNDDEIKQMVRASYASVIRSLMYTMLCTRPNIYFVVGLVSHYQSNLSLVHC